MSAPKTKLPNTYSLNSDGKEKLNIKRLKHKRNICKQALKVTEKAAQKSKGKNSRKKINIRMSPETEVQDESKSENDLSIGIHSPDHSQNKKTLIIPEVSAQNWTKFKTEFESEETDQSNSKLKKCLDRMHSYEMFELHFTALHFIRKAIVDSLLGRKWDSLVKLLVMLIKNYSDPVFTIFIRHLCEILKQYHPKIQGTDFEDQIDLIMEKYENKRKSRNYVTNIV